MQVDSEDYLQDIVFDYYGTKMAVCSSDRKIKVFEKNEIEDSWDPVACWEVKIIQIIPFIFNFKFS
jgi:hypothetical protein